MPRKPKLSIVKPKGHVSFSWRYHQNGNGRRRVWNDDWAGDQFEILTPGEFEDTERVFKRFGIVLNEATDDD